MTDILFQADPEPLWYSQLQRAVEQVQQKVLTPDQLMGAIKKVGVKADELYSTGFEDWLQLKGKVTKEEALEFLRQNGVQLEEVWYKADDQDRPPRRPEPPDVPQRDDFIPEDESDIVFHESNWETDEPDRDWLNERVDDNWDEYMRDYREEFDIDEDTPDDEIEDAVRDWAYDREERYYYEDSESPQTMSVEVEVGDRTYDFTVETGYGEERLYNQETGDYMDIGRRQTWEDAIREWLYEEGYVGSEPDLDDPDVQADIDARYQEAMERYEERQQEYQEELDRWEKAMANLEQERARRLADQANQPPEPEMWRARWFDTHAFRGGDRGTYREVALSLPKMRDPKGNVLYANETHYPGVDNLLGHVRFGIRTDASGKKVLFIHELQSDWHQEGRKAKGYKRLRPPPDTPEVAAMRQKHTELQQRVHQLAEAADQAEQQYLELRKKWSENHYETVMGDRVRKLYQLRPGQDPEYIEVATIHSDPEAARVTGVTWEPGVDVPSAIRQLTDDIVAAHNAHQDALDANYAARREFQAYDAEVGEILQGANPEHVAMRRHLKELGDAASSARDLWRETRRKVADRKYNFPDEYYADTLWTSVDDGAMQEVVRLRREADPLEYATFYLDKDGKPVVDWPQKDKAVAHEVRQAFDEFIEYVRADKAAERAVEAADEAYENYRNTLSDEVLHPRGDNKPWEAPFAKTWNILMVRSMMRYAAERGIDRVVLPSGQLAAEIEGHGITQFEAIRWNPKTNEVGGMQQGSWRDQYIQGGHDLDDYISADAARQMRELEPGEDGFVYLKTGDIVFGGEKMRWFYDRDLLNDVNNVILKKWKQKVVETEIFEGAAATGKTRKAHAIDMTPEMIEAFKGPQALFQQTKGAVTFPDPDGLKAIIHAEARDFSTLVHENSHIFRRVMADVAQRTGNEKIKADLRTMDTFVVQEAKRIAAKVKSGKKLTAYEEAVTGGRRDFIVDVDGGWQKIHEEIFARAFERYLTEGKAPTAQLARAFESMKAWMLQIYRAIAGSSIDVKINDEVRAVFDRMLGAEPRQAPAPKPRPTIDPSNAGLMRSMRAQRSDIYYQRAEPPAGPGGPPRLFQDGGDLPLLPPGGYNQLDQFVPMSRIMEDGWYDKVKPILDEMEKASQRPEFRYNFSDLDPDGRFGHPSPT